MTAVDESPTPFKTGNHNGNGKPRPRKPSYGLDRFLMTAKTVVSENYNGHRRPGQAKIQPSSVFIIWYAKVLGNWKAIVGSPAAKDLLWSVTYDAEKDVIYLDFYKTITNVVIPLESSPKKE